MVPTRGKDKRLLAVVEFPRFGERGQESGPYRSTSGCSDRKLRTTLDTVRGVRDDIHWVYDPEELATFRYNADALHHVEAHQNAPS